MNLKKFKEKFKVSIDIKILFENIIIYCAMFPWVSFGLNRMDSQPWILFSIVSYYLYIRKLNNKNLFYIWVITIILLTLINLYYYYAEKVIGPASITQFTYLLRGIASYYIIFLVWIFSIKVHKERNPLHHYIIGSLIYVFYGYLQSKGFSFLDWMAYDRTSGERGVTSFAPEPTHLGMILFFLSWLIFNSVQKLK